ncbi:cell envelope integrity protein TolA [Maridesulfovibrio salexigens]|uniref:Uncharacterized protein n=1 Tax=Maridesulfovibrio salexigens (strain ATCC 14822 / DSM 2638 / NCIMB 8403 / VKM B-1763) TaxID=526222 RepID=C6BVV8_MARSD|nr:cell envelope integrity protein TolA [Maridesulfovibrio salexigens]ACS80161.1 hypothetical protein Desal_2101 [Maridesulfovibrio salexigens DSM 2638]
MRYLAALLSILMHILIVIFVFDFVELTHDQESNGFGIELVSLVEKKAVAVHEPKQRVKPLRRERVKIKPEQFNESIRTDRPQRRASEIKVERAERKTVRTDHKSAPKPASKPAAESVPSTHKSYPHIETGTSDNPDAVILRQGKGITVGNSTMVLKRGSEARSLSAIAAYSFNEDDFRGHYETSTGRQVVIIDARAEYGRLILHDRKSGLIRKLKKYERGDFIYTYGPSFEDDEPVQGSVVFLPGDEHWIHRFMWMPEGEPAEYPVKGRVDAVSSGTDAGRRSLFVPAAKGRFPAVVLGSFGIDIPSEQFNEVARHLSGRDVVVMRLDSLDGLSLKKACAELRSNPKVDPGRIGVWFRGYGAKKMPRMNLPAGLFKFVILTIDHPDECLFPERLASVFADGLPTYFGFRGVSGDWKKVVPVMLTGFQSAPHQIIMIDDTPSSVEGMGTDQDWVDCLSGDFVNSISAWLDSN